MQQAVSFRGRHAAALAHLRQRWAKTDGAVGAAHQGSGDRSRKAKQELHSFCEQSRVALISIV